MPGGILDGLNEAQREAVTHDSGPLLEPWSRDELLDDMRRR